MGDMHLTGKGLLDIGPIIEHKYDEGDIGEAELGTGVKVGKWVSIDRANATTGGKEEEDITAIDRIIADTHRPRLLRQTSPESSSFSSYLPPLDQPYLYTTPERVSYKGKNYDERSAPEPLSIPNQSLNLVEVFGVDIAMAERALSYAQGGKISYFFLLTLVLLCTHCT